MKQRIIDELGEIEVEHGVKIIYQEKYSIAQKMRELAPVFYNPIASMYHYLRIAQGNYRDHLKGDRVWVKKYFYVLRPILAVNWLEMELGIVPTEFEVLVNKVVETGKLRDSIIELIGAKREGQELDYGRRIPKIGDFIERELARLEGKKFEAKMVQQEISNLNELFRSALVVVWG